MVGLLIVLWSVVLFNCGGTCRPGHIRLSCNKEIILYITVNVSEFKAMENILGILEVCSPGIIYFTLKHFIS